MCLCVWRQRVCDLVCMRSWRRRKKLERVVFKCRRSKSTSFSSHTDTHKQTEYGIAATANSLPSDEKVAPTKREVTNPHTCFSRSPSFRVVAVSWGALPSFSLFFFLLLVSLWVLLALRQGEENVSVHVFPAVRYDRHAMCEEMERRVRRGISKTIAERC